MRRGPAGVIPKGRGWMLRSESSGEDIYGRIVARVRVRAGSESSGEDIYGRIANQPSPSSPSPSP